MNDEPNETTIPPQEWNMPARDEGGSADQVHALAHRAEVGLEAGDGEALPVLEAFQQFLESERQRARRRMVILSGVFASVLCALTSWGIWYARTALAPVQRNFAGLQTDLDAFRRQADRDSEQIDSLLSRIGHEGRELRESVAEGRQSLAETRVSLKQETDVLRGDLEHMQGVIRDLQEENARLRRNMSGIEQKVPALLGQVEETLRRINVAPPAQDVAAPPPSGPLVLAVKPHGSDATVTWRLPLQE